MDKYSHDSAGMAVVSNIKRMVLESGINDNEFYRTFKREPLPLPVLKEVFQQYYYYIRTFPQILAGAAHRVDDERIRLKLARTVVSELGDNVGDPHFIMFEKVLAAVGVTLDDWRSVEYSCETRALVDGLRDLFLNKPTNYAIGAHYVIEEFGLPMITALYEGFRGYKGWKVDDFGYFYLHMLVEIEHVEWIRDAVIAASRDEDARSEIEVGAREVLKLLETFWAGLNRIATASSPALAVAP
jgi:pyrroloquinoline-quinone synthase